MGLGTLVGNERICAQLQRPGRLPNTILLAGPKGIGKHTLAQLLAQTMVCEDEAHAPCLRCRSCLNVEKGIHPDVIPLERFLEKEEQDKEIKIAPIRLLRQDAYIRPNQARRKVYLLSRADRMNENAQNALLKLLEEGPSYAAFLLLTDNPMGLLATIRSRCVRYDLSPVTVEEGLPVLRKRFPDRSEQEWKDALLRSGGILGQAIDDLSGHVETDEDTAKALNGLIAALSNPSELALMEWSVKYQLEKPSRAQLTAFYQGWNAFVLGDLKAEKKQTALTPKQLLDAQTLARQGLGALDRNVAAAHSIGWFAAELWELMGK